MLSEIPLLAFSNRMDDIITVVPATSGLGGGGQEDPGIRTTEERLHAILTYSMQHSPS